MDNRSLYYLFSKRWFCNIAFENYGETSVVNEKKLNEIKEILKVIKDNHACSFFRECFRGIPSSRPTSFINDINSVVHGSIVEIDIEKLKAYDDYVLMYLKAMSYSMNL